MSQPKKISVVMPVYNGERFLAPAMDSVLSQTFEDFDFVIVDDASTDRTPAILDEYRRRDSRIRILTNPTNVRQAKSLNRALREIDSPYIARQDADDISRPERFARQLAVLEASPSVGFVACHLQWIDELGQPSDSHVGQERHQEVMHWLMLFANPLGGGGHVTFRQETARKVGFYSEIRRFSEDADFWLKMICASECRVVPEILYEYRRAHAESFTVRHKEGQTREMHEATQEAVATSTGLHFDLKDIERLRQWSGQMLMKENEEPWLRETVERLRAAYKSPRPVDDLDARLRAVISEQWARVAANRKNSAGLSLRARCAVNAFREHPLQPVQFIAYRIRQSLLAKQTARRSASESASVR